MTVERAGGGDAPQGTVKREMQRIVASHTFYGSEDPVQNFVMVETGSPEETRAKLPVSKAGKYASACVREVWIANVLALLKVRRKAEDEAGDVPKKCAVEEKALVLYLELCNEKSDKIDAALSCAKLKWAQVRDDEDWGENLDSMRCVYGVVDVGSIRGLVHVLRGDYGLGISKTYKCDGDRHWADCWFYLNRFKLDRRGSKLFLPQTGEDEDDDDAVQIL